MATQTVDNANVTANSIAELEEISDSFLCSICLDLLYKPIVLSCGHISCFWCIHRSMNSLRVSKCPICRRMYVHFPSICVMLHRLLLKMYPIAYKMREDQILEEEKSHGRFSPQFDIGNELHHLSDSPHSSGMVCESTSKVGSHEKMEQLESASLAQNNDTTEKIYINSPSDELNDNFKQISIADALCAACKQLLVHPVVLNCGHVYCETCIILPTEQQLKCEVCQCVNPNGFPKVCLELDRFLEEQFCKEYALRRDVVQLKKVILKPESGNTCSKGKGAGKSGFTYSVGPNGVHHSSWLGNPHSKVHVGFGCDSCGLCPILGDRYRCKDCTEATGFDLCGDCYRTRSKIPGRFNQKHTSEHSLELVKTNIFRDMMILVSGRVVDGSTALVLTDDVFEQSGSPLTLPHVAEESTSGELTSSTTNSDNLIYRNNTEPTD